MSTSLRSSARRAAPLRLAYKVVAAALAFTAVGVLAAPKAHALSVTAQGSPGMASISPMAGLPRSCAICNATVAMGYATVWRSPSTTGWQYIKVRTQIWQYDEGYNGAWSVIGDWTDTGGWTGSGGYWTNPTHSVSVSAGYESYYFATMTVTWYNASYQQIGQKQYTTGQAATDYICGSSYGWPCNIGMTWTALGSIYMLNMR